MITIVSTTGNECALHMGKAKLLVTFAFCLFAELKIQATLTFVCKTIYSNIVNELH